MVCHTNFVRLCVMIHRVTQQIWEDPMTIDSANGYTATTRKWLNQRFDLFDPEGIYVPNQPSYGFSALAFRLEEYARMFAILRILDRIRFTSILDVGSADGYGLALVRHLFKVRAFGFDLSDRALVRAGEMYRLSGVCGDAHNLPFTDNAVDVVLASEVLEHVLDPDHCIRELLRVARKWVILSTPRASNDSDVHQHFASLDPGEPHAHIHFFTDQRIRALTNTSAHFLGARTRIISRLLNHLAWGDDSTLTQREAYFQFTIRSTDINPISQERLQWSLIGRYHPDSPMKKIITTPRMIGMLLQVDTWIAEARPHLSFDHLIIISKNNDRFNMTRTSGDGKILRELLGNFAVKPLKHRLAS